MAQFTPPSEADGTAFKVGQTTVTESNRGSPRLSGSQGSQRLIRDLFIWPGTIKARYQAQKDFIGYAQLITGPVAVPQQSPCRYISRTLPDFAQWTDAPTPALICTSFNDDAGAPPGVAPSFNATYNVNEYACTMAQVEYRSTNYAVLSDAACVNYLDPTINLGQQGYYFTNFKLNLPDEGLMMRYIERYWRYAGRVVTIPTGGTAFIADTNGASPDTAPPWPAAAGAPAVPLPITNKGGLPFREQLIELTYVWKFVPSAAIPTSAILAQGNTLNNNAFDLPGWRIPAGCALFIGAEPKNIDKNIPGYPACDMEYKFLVAPHVIQYGSNAGQWGGWNRGLMILPSNKADYRNIVVQYGGVPGTAVIPSTDFTQLFRPPQGPYTLPVGAG